MKLFTKGLLLIAIPSVIELALLSVVFDTQAAAARAARSAQISKQILWQASSLVDPLLREAARVRTGIALDDPSFIDRHAVWTEFADRIALLSRMVADNPDQLARVDHMRAAAYAWRAQAGDVADALRAGRSVAWARAAGAEMPPEIETVRGELDDFIADETRLDARRTASSTMTRTHQQDALIAAVLGSMLVWGVTAIVFARNVSSRLAALGDNARRLGEGVRLAPALSGDDEIAALDAVLHQTGARLRAAEQDQTVLKARLEARAKELAGVNEELRQETQDNEMFIYSVSHDLRSPLVNLQGFSKELQVSCDELRATVDAARLPQAEQQRLTNVLDGDVRESLQFLRTAVTRAAAIIEALLRISRAGRLEYQWQRVSIGRVVALVVDGLAGTIEARGAQVTVRELPPAWGDPGAIEQIFGNLIGNALNFLDPDRTGRIEIGAFEAEPVDERHPPAVRTRTYYVRDNGLGIPAAYMSKVFRAFQRLHGEVAKGDGIGLALVRRMVERHGGRVWVESAEGAGSTFFVVLPEQPARL
jgi:signal transduction histidine kinase